MPLFGVVSQEAKGHVVTTILIAMFAMLFTAISYGRMARAYPSAGSAFTYVGREIHPGLGFLTGWAMTLDYVLNPVICTIWCAKAAGNIVPEIPYAGWAVFFAVLFTMLNLRGIRASARTNEVLVTGMSVVIVVFFVAAVRYLLHAPGVDLVKPFYDPATFSFRSISTGTSLAVLTYIGFDGISTLSEEVENPRRNILLATVFTCVVTGLLSMAEVYLGQLVWPQYATYPDADTAFVHVAGRAGGAWLFQAVNLTLLVATVGSGMGAQLAGARLLYGMGRDNVIPQSFFGALDPRRNIPRNNVLLTGAIALAGAFTISYQLGAELLNFGAILGFMGVNLAAFLRYYVRDREKKLTHCVPPLLGFMVCFLLWIRLNTPALMAGGAWLAVGIAYAAVKTGGFRRKLEFSEMPPE
ncbi:MAG: APC family permease [Acidobacteria bacterium]|nr:APC family permease [Acidobacteriota bacterium]MBI3471991.1 APC family permease [Candidatus Solibacter usitatus]